MKRRTLAALAVFAAAIITAVVALSASAAVTPTLTVLSSLSVGGLHAEWTNPDDPAGVSYNAVRCQDNATPISDLGRWKRWPGNYTEGTAETTVFQDGTQVQPRHSYRCYVTEIDQAGGLGGRSNLVDATVLAPDPTPTPEPTVSPDPTSTPEPPDPTPTPEPSPSPSPSPSPTPEPGIIPADAKPVFSDNFEGALSSLSKVPRPPSRRRVTGPG
jgi:hypothetical protein